MPIGSNTVEQEELAKLSPEFQAIVKRYRPTVIQVLVEWHCSSGHDRQYRHPGINKLIVNYETILTFNSQNFGICCGAQLLTDFYSYVDNNDFISDIFGEYVREIAIPHFMILVKIARDTEWEWTAAYYEAIAKHGRLIREWRNPFYPNHLLCLYECYDFKKYDDFMTDLTPVNRSIKF